MYDLFTFGGVNFIHLVDERECFLLFQCGFFCVNLFGDFDVCLRKKLLRFATGFSSRPMVTPVELCHVHSPFVNVGYDLSCAV